MHHGKSWRREPKAGLSKMLIKTLQPNWPMREAATSAIIRMTENESPTHGNVEMKNTPQLQFQDQESMATRPTCHDS